MDKTETGPLKVKLVFSYWIVINSKALSENFLWFLLTSIDYSPINRVSLPEREEPPEDGPDGVAVVVVISDLNAPEIEKII